MKPSQSKYDAEKVRKTKKLRDHLASVLSSIKRNRGKSHSVTRAMKSISQDEKKSKPAIIAEVQEDDFKSPLFVNGFVIISPIDDADVNSQEDEQPLAKWISDRVFKMDINPSMVSLNEIRDYPYFPEDTQGQCLDKEFRVIMDADLDEINPVWKTVVRNDMIESSLKASNKNPRQNYPQPVDIAEVQKVFLYLKDVVLRKLTSDNIVWVIIVPNEFKNCMEIDLLHALSDQFSFRVMAVSEPHKANVLKMLVAIGERKAELLLQATIKVSPKLRNIWKDEHQTSSTPEENPSLSKSDHRNNNNNLTVTIRDSKSRVDLQTLHREGNYLRLSPNNVSVENIMLEDYENEVHFANIHELGILKSSDSDSDHESSSFEMGEENVIMYLYEAISTVIPKPVNPKEYFRQSKDASTPRPLVIIIRELTGCSSNSLSLARTVQERLRKLKVKSYIITISSILKELQTLKLARYHAIRIAHESDKDILDGYVRLILAIIANKIQKKKQHVILIDIGDEAVIRLWPVKDFCMRLRVEIFTLNSLHETLLESNLRKVIHEVSKRYKEMDWTAPVPIYDNNENVQESQEFQNSDLTNPEYLLSLQRPEILELKTFDGDDESKSNDNDNIRGSESSMYKAMETCSDLNQSVIPDEGNESHDSVDDTESEDTSSQNTFKSSTNKTKRRKKRKQLNKVKSNASTDTETSLQKELDAIIARIDSINSLRVDNDNYESEKTRTNEIFNPKLSLLLIQKVPDDSRYPSRLSSDLIEKDLAKDEESTYKGWVAVENENPDRSTRYIAHKFRSRSKIQPDATEVPQNTKRGFFKRFLRPIGLFITCQYCRSSRNSQRRVSPEERLGYKGISLSNAHDFAF